MCLNEVFVLRLSCIGEEKTQKQTNCNYNKMETYKQSEKRRGEINSNAQFMYTKNI